MRFNLRMIHIQTYIKHMEISTKIFCRPSRELFRSMNAKAIPADLPFFEMVSRYVFTYVLGRNRTNF